MLIADVRRLWRLSFIEILWFMLSASFAGAQVPGPLQAKKDAEAKGYVFHASHDEILAAAKKEGKLRALSGFPPQAIRILAAGFKRKYPFIDTQVEELESTGGYQRFALEMKAGRRTGWDATVIGIEFYRDYAPYQKRFDILGMAQQGILSIPPKMIDPFSRSIISPCSGMQVIAFNRKAISENKVPSTWEGFLEPEFKGKKFLADIRPKDVAALVPAWGLERTLEFAHKLAAQQPLWVRGGSRLLNSVAAGEYPLFLGPNFNTIKRAQSKDMSGNLSYKILEPVPTRLFHMAEGVLDSAEHPYAALLWLEFLASPEGQKTLDEQGPFLASVFNAGSAMERETKGKKLSGIDWYHLTKIEEYQAKIVEAYGFPQAEQK